MRPPNKPAAYRRIKPLLIKNITQLPQTKIIKKDKNIKRLIITIS